MMSSPDLRMLKADPGRRLGLCLWFAGLLCMGACPRIGDGELGEQTRVISGPVRALEVLDDLQVVVTSDPNASEGATLVLRTDSNLLDRVITERHSDDVLGVGIEATSESKPTLGIDIDISTPGLERIFAADNSRLELRDHEGELLTVRARDQATIRAVGKSDFLAIDGLQDTSIELAGSAQEIDLKTVDAATIDASALTVVDAEISHESSGEVRLCASGTIRGTMRGQGSLVLLCPPSSLEVEVLGEGSILWP